MSAWSIRARLTLWFAAVLGLVLLAITATTWVELRETFTDAIDRSLADRVDAVDRFLNEPSTPASFDELREDLREYVALDPGWNLVRISDDGGHWLYSSPAFESGPLPRAADSELVRGLVYHDVTLRGHPLRLVTARVGIKGQRYLVQIALPVREVREVLQEFRLASLLLIPVGMLAAALGGYWISRRALLPVDRINATLRAITADRLDRRLDVPRTGDELQRLSVTLNEMLNRLASAFRETSRFTADASHELRTPVSLIRTTAEVALRRPRSAEEYRQALETVLDEAERTSELVQNLLILARVESGIESLQGSVVDLRELLSRLAGPCREMCARAGLEWRIDLPESAVTVPGEPLLCERLVTVLVENAVKYTPAPGRVAVTLRERNGQAMVEVADSGIGVAPEDIPHVFERFYRADKARSRDSGGAGLGLSIARLIAERHGGAITMSSEPGHGSTLTVTLPLAPVADGRRSIPD